MAYPIWSVDGNGTETNLRLFQYKRTARQRIQAIFTVTKILDFFKLTNIEFAKNYYLCIKLR